MTIAVETLPNYYAVIRHWAQQQPERHAFHFLPDGEAIEASLTFGELDARARSVAGLLQANGWCTAPVLLQYRPGLDFIVAFLGCLYAGAIAVPAYPPTANRSKADRLQKLIDDCGAGVVLTNAATHADLLRDLPNAAGALPVVCTDQSAAHGEAWRDPGADAASIAFLQYSSGSTGDPKGVIVTHGNLMHNQATIRAAMGNGPHTVFASWLPLYHDMGLIGNVMQPLFLGVPCYLMPPMAFLQKPLRWLKVISDYRVTCTGGPNFAYDLCVDKVGADERAELDLSSWAVAYNGSETVRPDTLRRFAAAFQASGLAPTSIYPCYGLAEATLLVTGPAPGSHPRVLCVAAGALEQGRIVPMSAGLPGSRELAGCGRVLGNQRVLIVDPATRLRCADGQVGELWLQGPSISTGYWRRDDVNARVFATLADDASVTYSRTGDLGFFDGPDMYMTGRLKEVLIVRGRNHYPQDIEHTVQRCWPGFVLGGGAAFLQGEPGREQLVLVQEIARTALRSYQHAQAEQMARDAVATHHGLTLAQLVPIRPATLAKTSSGKIRRGFMRQQFMDGELARIDLGTAGAAPAQAAPALFAPLAAALADMGIGAPLLRADASLAGLGLDSLQIVELQERLGRRLGATAPLDLLFGPQPLAALGAQLAALAPDSAAPVQVPAADSDALTPYQWAIWLHQQQHAGPVYNLALALEVERSCGDSVAAALTALMAHQPHLRSLVREADDGSLRWEALADMPQGWLARTDAASWSAARLDGELSAFRARPFDLGREAPLRAWLLERGGRAPLLALCVHHIATDLHGLRTLTSALLGALAGAAPETVPAAPLALLSEAAARAAAPDPAWLARLAAAHSSLDLGLARPRGGAVHAGAATAAASLPADLLAALRAMAAQASCTLNVLLSAAFGTLLQRYTQQDSVSLGMPFSVRPTELDGWSGNAVNMLPLALQFGPEATLDELIGQTRQGIADGLQHRHLALPRVAEAVRRLRPERAALFDAVFICQPEYGGHEAGLASLLAGSDAWSVSSRWPGLRVRSRAIAASASQAMLTLLVFPQAHTATLTLEFDPARVPARFARALLVHYEGLLRAMVRDPQLPLHQLAYLPQDELALQWHTWNATPAPLAGGTPVAMFLERVAAQPDAPAIIDASGAWSYAELALAARHFRAQLRAHGVGRGDSVGIALPRDRYLAAAVLGVQMSGAAYVPLDLDYPAERLRYIVDNSGARYVISVPAQAAQFAEAGAHCLYYASADAGPDEDTLPAPDDLAYVLYTSGSTGQPKGVQVSHASVTALLGWAREALSEQERALVLASTSVCFDLSVFELFVPLCLGTTCVMVRGVLDLVDALPAPVTLINTVPSAIEALLAADAIPPSTVTALVAGEPFRQVLVERLYARSRVRRVLDLYGPTEDTVYSTVAERRVGGSETIGRPLPGTRAYVLDARQQPVPVGLPGELYLAGAGLSIGYRGRDDLTAQAFSLPPALAHLEQRTYRTGDLVRLGENGEIVYLGRGDQQVKLRGYRIELQEVEAALLASAAVREAAAQVITNANGQAVLVAYVAWRGGARESDLQAELARRVPPYMRPSQIITLEQLPRTLNGKIDRKALPREAEAAAPGATLADGMESTLARLWAEVLGVAPLRRSDHFLELGGNSLQAVQLRSLLQRQLGLDVALAVLFAVPVLGEQADLLEAMRGAAGVDEQHELEEIEL